MTELERLQHVRREISGIIAYLEFIKHACEKVSFSTGMFVGEALHSMQRALSETEEKIRQEGEKV